MQEKFCRRFADENTRGKFWDTNILPVGSPVPELYKNRQFFFFLCVRFRDENLCGWRQSPPKLRSKINFHPSILPLPPIICIFCLNVYNTWFRWTLRKIIPGAANASTSSYLADVEIRKILELSKSKVL